MRTCAPDEALPRSNLQTLHPPRTLANRNRAPGPAKPQKTRTPPYFRASGVTVTSTRFPSRSTITFTAVPIFTASSAYV